MQRRVRGVSHGNRLHVLELLKYKPDLSVFEIAEHLDTDLANASQHLQKMLTGGMIRKRRDGNMVRHALSPLGEEFAKFLFKGKI